MLPPDLRHAEAEALEALIQALISDPKGRWTVEFRFEGLRLMPVALRLAQKLMESRSDSAQASPGPGDVLMLFPDAGAMALARRDQPAMAGIISSLGDLRRRQSDGPSEGVLLLASAGPADYEDVEALCEHHRGAVVLLNGVLEDGAVGIGSVARERRRGFLASWQSAYALIPQSGAALKRAWPEPWRLYRQDPDGYRAVATFEGRPDSEQQAEALESGSGSGGFGAGLRALDQLIEGLNH